MSLVLGMIGQAFAHTTLWLIVLTCYAFAVIMTAFSVRRSDNANSSQPQLCRMAEIAFLVGILVVASAMRFRNLAELPPGIWFDEAANGIFARNLLDKAYTPFLSEVGGKETLYLYLLAIPLRLLGSTAFSLRLVSATAGVTTVVVFYFIAREFVGSRPALVATFLLAVSHWHVQFSRMAMRGILLPLLVVLTFCFLFRAFRTRQWLHFVLSGFFLGLSAHTYVPARVFPIVIFLTILCFVWQHRSELTALWKPLLALATVALIVASPLIVFAIRNYTEFADRPASISIFDPQNRTSSFLSTLAETSKDTLLMFNIKGDMIPRHNLPGAPMLEFATAVLFTLGLAISIVRIRRWEYFALVCWFVLLVIPGMLTTQTPHALRTIGVLPAVFLFASIFIAEVWAKFRNSNRFLRSLLPFFVVAILLSSGWQGYSVYFNKHPKTDGLREGFNVASSLLSRRANSYRNEGARVVLHPSIPDINGETVYEFYNNGKPIPSFNLTDLVPIRSGSQKNTVILFGKYQMDALPLIKEVSPYFEKIWDMRTSDGRLAYAEIWYSSKNIADQNRLTARYFAGTSSSGEPLIETSPRELPNWKTIRPPVEAPFTAVWSGGFFAERSGTFEFEVATECAASLLVNEESILNKKKDLPTSAAGGKVFLRRGLHSFELRIVADEEPRSMRVSWKKPDRRFELLSEFHEHNPRQQGLIGTYYLGTEWSGEPILVQRDPIVFPNVPVAAPYSVEWRAILMIPEDAEYTFQLTSDDGSHLYLDDSLIINNGGTHGPATKTGAISLTEGPHDLSLRYMDAGGLKVLFLRWQDKTGEFVPIPRDLFLLPTDYRMNGEVRALQNQNTDSAL